MRQNFEQIRSLPEIYHKLNVQVVSDKVKMFHMKYLQQKMFYEKAL